MCSKKLMVLVGAVLVWIGAALLDAHPTFAQPDRPLIFIPGVLGSRLVDETGRVVWGDRNSLSRFGELEIGSSGSLHPLKPDGLIERINVLGPFWTIHAYASLLDRLHKFGYVDGVNLFIFAYDWRESNFDTAHHLDQFIKARPALAGAKFDILAHSMGGLVAKIWALEGANASRIDKIIYMATPFQGSMNALATLSSGWRLFANYVAGGLSTIRRVALSFPSTYEMFPTYDRCCRLGTPQHLAYLDILGPDTWRSRDWLPVEYRQGQPRAAEFEGGLERARRLSSLMRQEVPNVSEVKFAGDVIDTRLWLYVDNKNQGWQDWTFRSSRGDGTVPVWSAANNFESLAGTYPSFAEHATIFNDEWLENLLARELFKSPPPPVRLLSAEEISTADGVKRLSLVKAKLSPPVAAPGETTSIELTLEFADDIAAGSLVPSASIDAGSQPESISFHEITSDADVATRRLRFVGTLPAPSEEDTYRIDLLIPGKGSLAEYLSVMRPKGAVQ